MTAGEQIAALRTAAGISRAELGRKLGLTRQRVSLLEKSDDVNYSTLLRVCEAVGIKIVFLPVAAGIIHQPTFNMDINQQSTIKNYNVASTDDTKAVATPDGGVQVRRISRPRDDRFSQVVLATADREGNVTHAPDWEDHGDLLAECIVYD